jgi:hypothetical protein
VLAQAAAELVPALDGTAATARRFVNVLLGVIPALGRTPEVVERSLQPWRGVLSDEMRKDLGWDAVAFSWVDEDTAQKVGSVTRTVGSGDRNLLVLTAAFEDTVRLHLRRAREYVKPFDDTGAHPGQITREGVIRALCDEIRARRARRERRDPLTIGKDELMGLAAHLNDLVGTTNPLVAILGRDLCSEDLLDGLPELFSNVILVAMADEEQVDRLGPKYVVLRPQREDEVLQWLDRLTV